MSISLNLSELEMTTVASYMRSLGGFDSLLECLNKGHISPTQAGALSHRLFDHLQSQLREARVETQKLQAVLTRLDHSVQALKARASGQPKETLQRTNTMMTNDVYALHGWTKSLYETDITILRFFQNLTLVVEHNRSVGSFTERQLSQNELGLMIKLQR